MNHRTIALSGLNDTDAAMFEAALGSLPVHAWKLVDTPPADLLVVDVDTVWGHMDWLRATATGQPVVAYTNDESAHRDDMFLLKPLRTRNLAELLDSLPPRAAREQDDMPDEAPATPPAATAMPDTDETVMPAVIDMPEAALAPEPEPVIEPEPAPGPDTPLGECLLRGGLDHAVSLQDGDITLQLDPERGGYTGPSALKPLQVLLARPIGDAVPLTGNALAAMRQGAAIPLTRLIWFAALVATPGQLAPELDPQARYHLTRWPQIEREFPRHFRIATAMMKGPGTLGDIASMANAPATDVADFINAYSLAGYVANDTPAAPAEPDEGSDKRMFSRLRRSLSRTAT